MNSNQILKFLAVSLIAYFSFTACVKKEFDNPPNSDNVDPNLPVNASILDLKKLYTGTTTLVDTNITIAGIVTADDRSGGFYKQIVIQDTSSGVQINIGRSGLYADYPIGRKVYVKCKGLYLGAYGGFIQLGYTPDLTNAVSDIPWSLIGNFIIKGNTGNKVTPQTLTITQLKTLLNTTDATKYMGTLIKIDSAEFTSDIAGLSPFAQDPNISSGTDRKIKDCNNQQIVIRMSGYANYRTAILPSGKGPVTAIYSRYNSTPQLLIRDTTDLQMTGVRCDGSVFQPPVPISIDSVRRRWTGSGITLGNVSIHGVITSSWTDSNIVKTTAYMQDESGRGINLFFGTTHGFNLGDSITINLTGDSLITYAGILELKVSVSKTVKSGTGKTVIPAPIDIATLNTDLSQADPSKRIYESRVVKIVNATINGGTQIAYKGELPVNDGGAINMTMFTRNAALFANTLTPSGAVDITAIASKFNTKNQILLRKVPQDIQ